MLETILGRIEKDKIDINFDSLDKAITRVKVSTKCMPGDEEHIMNYIKRTACDK